MNQFYKLLTLLLFVFISGSAFAQGLTTSSMSGEVYDMTAEPLPGATVIAIHEPTGTQYGVATLPDGSFKIPNMKIGGPYRITVTFVGFIQEQLYVEKLQLGENFSFTIALMEESTSLGEVEVVASKSDDAEKTGAATYVKGEQLRELPSIARSQQDFTRLTPQSDGFSFGGRNSLYNNFSLDGSVFNNSYGLDVPTPGGQTGAQPVSLDAIDQIQVSMAPFDVRQGGFTGAGINAVTRSGTNEISASVYHFFRNENFVGEKVSDVKVPNLDFSTNTSGFRVGGPIIKNKLFFFVNGELERRNELATGYVASNSENQGDPNATTVSESDIIAVQNHFRNQYNYDPGAYQGYFHETYNDKILIKLDWSINDKNNFSIRYNYLKSWKDILPHPEALGGRAPEPFRLAFENASYRINNNINSIIGELNSQLSNNLFNKLVVGYSAFRDFRDPKTKNFPTINILDENGQIAIFAGSELFSTENVLNQDVFQINDNLTIVKDKHMFTVGTNFEYFSFENSFNLFYYPQYFAASVDDFLNNTYVDAGVIDDFTPIIDDANQKPLNITNVEVAQWAIYGQDEFTVNSKFKLTAGLRIDIPLYFSDINGDPRVDGYDGWVDENGNPAEFKASEWPDSKVLWSPRVGFNYKPLETNKLTVRGGTGIFTGRIPFVWLGNQAGNARFTPGYTFQVNSTADDFKFPQVWKTNLAIDYSTDNNWTFTGELLYGKDVNAVVHRNYNMNVPTERLSGTGDDRLIFTDFSDVNIYSTDPDSETFLDAGAILLDNTSKGYQFNVTGQVSKSFENGLNFMAAYTYLDSKDLTSIPAEIAADAFQRNVVAGNPNNPDYSWSRYGMEHRLIASFNYAKSYSKDKFRTSIGMFYEIGSGGRYNMVYATAPDAAASINGDNIAFNDLIYIPANSSDINFGTVDVNGAGVEAADAAQQWAALDAFISSNDYLDSRRGKYFERNGGQLPWFAQMDIKFLQDFNFIAAGKTNTIQLSVDILNFGNLLNSDWGVRQILSTNSPITYTGTDNNNVPYFNFNTDLKDSYTDNVSLVSKWQMQIGVRYIFN
ncbi:TonB-dependent receptor [Marinigracilibium pacificum]|uniref:TonB-dependent receptor n=1 Tax=Marinigracilibium pacificum TaxID=2729599 RepID=A0A848J510_9BACT|nr:TonB-dependent receptor [Marinigracilibium pacificum]NMM48242.1 TonB-dependent receptor [Marinigracilibium pacificum]